MFLLQIRVAAGMKRFDPNNLHFHVVYSLHTRCVKAFNVIWLRLINLSIEIFAHLKPYLHGVSITWDPPNLIIFWVFTSLMAFSLLFLWMVYMYQVDPAPKILLRPSKAASVVLFDQERGREKAQKKQKRKKKYNPAKSERCRFTRD